MKDKTKVALAAIFGIFALEGIALLMGRDGAMFGACIAAISGLGGFVLGRGSG